MIFEDGLKTPLLPEGILGLSAKPSLRGDSNAERYGIYVNCFLVLTLYWIVKLDKATFSYDVLQQPQPQHQTLRLPTPPPSHSAPNPETLSALYSIHKTPYLSSFASRLLGTHGTCQEHQRLIHRDWETCSPWMDLLSDIRLHYSLRK